MRKISSSPGDRPKYSIRILLIVLVMLCGHAALASHQAMHESTAELSACASCLASDAFDYLLTSNDDGPSLKIVHVTTETGSHQAPAKRTVCNTTIRAPPLTTF